MSPNVSAVGILLAVRQHRYWRFIGVEDALGQHCFSQRMEQWLKLHAGLAHALRHHHMRQQVGRLNDFTGTCRARAVTESASNGTLSAI